MRQGSLTDRFQSPGVLVGACALAYLPFTLLGYGTDIDAANVLRAGRSWLDDGHYHLSRGPGAAIQEVATAALDKIGGSVLVNLVAVGFAALALWAVQALVHHDGGPHPRGALLMLATSPWFWIAATSLADFVWALALVLAGAVAAQRDRRWLAGLLFGLAIGCRASSVLLVMAWLVAERGGGARERVGWRPIAMTGLVAVMVGVACFVPPWLDAGRTMSFLHNELAFEGVRVHLGRWLVKNVAVIGVPAGLVLLVGIGPLARVISRWRASTVVRFALISLVLSEALFFRLPFKPLHLLPVVACLALLVGMSTDVRRRWLVVLVVAQLIGGLIGTTLAAPDVQDAAQSGSLELGVRAGPLLTDVRCRLDDRARGPWPVAASAAATRRAAVNADCQNQAWRAH